MKGFKYIYILFLFSVSFFPGYAKDNLGLLVSPGELSSVHTESGGIRNCTKCHTEGKRVDVKKCLSCHKELEKRVRKKRGFHSDKRDKCSSCHPEHLGKEFKLIEWDRKKFNHSKTGYSIKGLHLKIDKCEKCHKKENSPKPKAYSSFFIKSSACAVCHKDPHKGSLGNNCEKCHSVEKQFKSTKENFDHNQTHFALKGKHKKVDCIKCHKANRWKGLKFSSCSNCHKDPHRAKFGKRCNSCHNEKSWKVRVFDHNRTKYPLRGKHSSLKCAKCHKTGKEKKINKYSDCRDCHKKDPHLTQFDRDCKKCHTVYGFKKTIFSHDSSSFKLKGKHVRTECKKCHVKEKKTGIVRYIPLKKLCSDCHNDIHFGQLSKKCDTCHNEKGFKKNYLSFDHNRDSKYQLTGKHLESDCSKCHKKEEGVFPEKPGIAIRFKPMKKECMACHNDIHDGSLGRSCEKCHVTDDFHKVVNFDHEKTEFPLTVFHEKVKCEKCHPEYKTRPSNIKNRKVIFKLSSTSCLSCHRDFDHRRTALPLSGKHSKIECGKCHNSKTPNLKRFRRASKPALSCQNCHRSPHVERYKNCSRCHGQDSWIVDTWR